MLVKYISDPIGTLGFYQDQKQNGIAECQVCGHAYLSIEGSLNCRSCRTKMRRIKHRANKACVEYDRSITLLAVYNKFNGICCDCHAHLNHPRETSSSPLSLLPTIEHIVPLSKGGNHTWSNVELLCYICNNNRNKEYQFVENERLNNDRK